MKADDIEFTKTWWAALLADEPRFIAWLKKLRNTEHAGYTDYTGYIDRFCSGEDRAAVRIFQKIAEDEAKHAVILTDLLAARGVQHPDYTTSSAYWEEVNGHITDLRTAAAVSYFGEDLAAERFEILHQHPDTPADFRTALDTILPEEVYHRVALGRLAGEEVIERLRPVHEAATLRLRTKR